MKDEILTIMRCPQTGEALVRNANKLSTISGSQSYDIDSEIPLFAQQFLSTDAKIQQAHYDKVASNYIANMHYPHTQEYMRYLDQAFLSMLDPSEMDCVLEICCGKGEAFELLQNHVKNGLGVDVSIRMLKAAKQNFPGSDYTFLQADATHLPLSDNSISHVFILGGIHHVNQRQLLFNEIWRVLKPGGKFYWREPVSDFFLWRWIRALVYRISPNLDHNTEQPLRHKETVPLLQKSGFKCLRWETLGLIGFCFFMNSDILIFNRLFRFIPGIRSITRWFVNLDKLMIKIPGLKYAGLQVVGCAEKI